MTASLLEEFIRTNVKRLSYEEIERVLCKVLDLVNSPIATVDTKEVLCRSLKMAIIKADCSPV